MKYGQMFTGVLSILLLYLLIIVIVLVVGGMGPARATVDTSNQPAVTATDDEIYYLPLKDAPPQRDITKQRFAPLETD